MYFWYIVWNLDGHRVMVVDSHGVRILLCPVVSGGIHYG